MIGGRLDKIFAFLGKPSKYPSSEGFLNLKPVMVSKVSRNFLIFQSNVADSEKNENWKSGQSTIIMLKQRQLPRKQK